MTETIESKILTGIGITKGALELAERVNQLKESDPNIDRVDFSRHSLKGYADSPFLVANVKLTQPFQDVEAFREYLGKHGFPNTNSDIIVEGENPLNIGFATNGYTSDAFCARFYQPYSIRSQG